LRLQNLDGVPVGIELVGEDHRETGADAGAHLGAMHDQHDLAGRRDRYIDVRRKHRFDAARRSKRARRKRHGRAADLQA
jgi:hypothetical protein